MSGPVRISDLKTKGKAQAKKVAAQGGREAYKFVSENLGGTSLDRVGRVALGVLAEAGRKVSDLWTVKAAGETERERYRDLRRTWLRKRLKGLLKK